MIKDNTRYRLGRNITVKFEKVSCTTSITHTPQKWKGEIKVIGKVKVTTGNVKLFSRVNIMFEVDAILINWINHKIMNEVEATGNVKALTLTVEFQSHQYMYYLCMILMKMCFEWYIALWNWTRGKHFVCLDLFIPSDNCMYIS